MIDMLRDKPANTSCCRPPTNRTGSSQGEDGSTTAGGTRNADRLASASEGRGRQQQGTMATVTKANRDWLVLLRDVSRSVRVQGEPRIVACLVLDVDSGGVLGHAVAATDDEAITQACHTALKKPARPFQPGPPDAVLCSAGLAGRLTRELGRSKSATSLPPITEVGQVHEAEDIFDSFVGHMAGRRQPDEFPAPEDWQLLFVEALNFYRREPWRRLTDEIDLAVDTTIGDDVRDYTAIVLGSEGIQHGLVLYPGSGAAGLRQVEPGTRVPMLPGTLLFTLDPPDGPPEELVGKAHRYGWPPDSELVPVFFTVDGDGPGELGRSDVQRLTVATAAVTRHDARGPVLVRAPDETLDGIVVLAGATSASFRIRQLPFIPPSGEILRAHLAGTDLVAEGTPVVIGSTSVEALDRFRRKARLHRPLPAGVSARTPKVVPLVAIIAEGEQAATISAKVAEMDPYGVGIIEMDRRAVVTLVGGQGAQLLLNLAADDEALVKYRSRLKRAKGYHALLIADEASLGDGDEIYGLYECQLPEAQASPARPRR
jgi:hypothetical protein